jgi:hypothetical protein
VKTILLSGAISMIVALLGTRPTITVLRKRKLGQQIRTDGPQAHLGKSGTPTMGGIVIIIASLVGYVLGHWFTGDPMTASGVLVLFLMTGLGFVGFLDDFIKLFMRRSLGLRSGAKLLGQAIVGAVFAVLAIHFPDGYDLTPASTHISFLADFGVSIGAVLFVVWVLLMVTATSNGVNLTDGLDGLASGASILVLAAYVIIAGPELLRRPRPARRRGGRRGRDGRLLRLPVVERAARQDLHGRHRLPRPRRRPGGPGHRHPHGSAAAPARRPVRDHHDVRGDPGRLLQAAPQARIQDGAAPASLRTRRLGGNNDRGPLLADSRHVRGLGPGHLLRGLVP